MKHTISKLTLCIEQYIRHSTSREQLNTEQARANALHMTNTGHLQYALHQNKHWPSPFSASPSAGQLLSSLVYLTRNRSANQSTATFGVIRLERLKKLPRLESGQPRWELGTSQKQAQSVSTTPICPKQNEEQTQLNVAIYSSRILGFFSWQSVRDFWRIKWHGIRFMSE
jgi:hypothetical protein